MRSVIWMVSVLTLCLDMAILYASLTVLRWMPKDFPETVVNLDGTSGLNRAQLFTNLTAGYFYVLVVQQTSEAMRDPEYYKVTIGLF